MQKLRFIPAVAGNSELGLGGIDLLTVHPRGRGEQLHSRFGAGLAFGSSPRSRGTGQIRPALFECFRFIPAVAGNRLKTNHCF